VSPAVNVDGRPVFQTLVLYEDYAAGRRATDTCNLLMARLGDEFELRCNLWKFEVLRNSKLNELAAVEAMEADVIIVAAHGCTPLPAEVTAWVDAWLPGRGTHPAALIAVVDSTFQKQERSSATSDYLRSVAAAANMDFLTQVTAFTANDSAVPRVPPGLEANPSLPGEVPRWNSAERHWGINE
jgi:hypothetical protein